MKLQEYRKLRGLSRAAFGKLVGANWVTVYRWETGRSMPKPAMIQRIWANTQGAVTADDHHQAVATSKEGRAAL
jgi:DNA-binding XRE family transcriptional regulator